MKTQKTRYARYLALALALTGLFAMAPAASAQYPNQNRDAYRNRRGMRSQSYDRLRQWARELEDVAGRANDQAQAQQGGYRGFRRDTNFLRSIDHFSAQSQAFRARIETYQTQPWDVDAEVQHLLQDARNVQGRLRRARFVDRRTVSDWNQVVNLLNQMTTEYRSAGGYRSGFPNGDPRTGQYPNNSDPRTNPYPNNGEYRTEPHSHDGDSHTHAGEPPAYGTYGNSTDLRQLAAELDQRAARASELSGGYSGYSPNISHFSEQARSFRGLLDQNRITGPELRSQINHLLEDAQSSQDELSRRSASREVVNEWNAIVQILTRMRDSS